MILASCAALAAVFGSQLDGPGIPLAKLGQYDVSWDSPSDDAAGSMPIGNGEVVLNVWVEKTTGDLLFYIARSDALSEISRVLKLGRVRVHFSGSPLLEPGFSQHLVLHDGQIDVNSPGLSLVLFVDSGANVIHIRGRSTKPAQATITVEDWRDANRQLPKQEMGSAWAVQDAPFPLVESADKFQPLDGGIAWYHRNESSVVPKLWDQQSIQSLSGRWDPLLHRTFGGYLTGPRMHAVSPTSIASDGETGSFEACIATVSLQTDSVSDWLERAKAEAAKSPLAAAEARTKTWWAQFWDRSWVFVETSKDPSIGETITRGYILQRYVQACQGRGAYPIKFNGGYYTVEPKAMGMPYNADFRNWGDSVWFQNVRHTVAPMLASGDFEMMDPFFSFYEQAEPLCAARAKAYYGADGVYFPETMTDFGTYSGGDYGWDRSGHKASEVLCPWWATAWNQGPELVMLMLDRYDYTLDEKFLKKHVLPMAEAVLRYFDSRFKRDAQGRIVLDPTQSVETYWTGVINDMPSTAGLRAVTSRLCSLPTRLMTAKQRAFFEAMRKACPELPVKNARGGRELAPAQKYDPKTSNCENPELYAVWPFRLVSVGQPEHLDAAKLAYKNRLNKLDVGWGYDGNVAALLGMADEAGRILLVKCENSHTGYRWPATWGPNFDWLPDQNHGGNLLNTCNLMLLQSDPLDEGGKIRVLPAWPKDWDVDFKLHAMGKTTVQCVVKDGAVTQLTVTPDSRKGDVQR